MPAKEADLRDMRMSTFLDRQGELVVLPKQLVPSFARVAAKKGIERIKRFHIGNTYRTSPNGVGGHPKILKAAIFDVITSDPTTGVSEAETVAIVSEIIDIFPGLNASTYDIHISHTKGMETCTLADLLQAKKAAVSEVALSRLPEEQRKNVKAILDNSRTALPLKRTLLTKLGLARATLDDIEALLPTGLFPSQP
jgi:eukaryotic translation initiation factor 2-alpha kinase 4